MSWAADAPRDIKITRVTSWRIKSRRPKYVGKNARRDDHGEFATDVLLRIQTNAGVEGVGHSWATADQAARLLDTNPLDYFRPDEHCTDSPLGWQSQPLWDLIGRILDKPVYELLGGKGPQRVGVYDGTIYMLDLLPAYQQKWPDIFLYELDMGLNRGHRAFKVKIGRGFQWMKPEEGYKRDVEVLKIIRRHVGPDVVIGVDANTKYGLEQAKRLLNDLPDAHLAFVEEMFEDSVDDCLALKASIREQGLKTMVADGENHDRPEPMQEWVDAKAVDLLQGDMNRFGFEGILAEAAMARPSGAMVAPHNWGSLMGYYAQLQVGRAIDNFYRAEQDYLECPALIAEGYDLKDGTSSVPNTPGMGLKLNENKLPECSRLHFDRKL
jgi:L-alanine-DL-glutamate epimerase-like enolase superfamily enzyme